MEFTNNEADLELLAACQNGDQRAQFQFYRRFQGLVMSICMRYANNREEAMEVCNTTFIKAFAAADRYEAKGSLAGWVGRIALYASIDFVRQRASYRRKVTYPENIPDVPVHNEAIDRISEQELLALIQSLPEACRSVFCLYVIEGFTHEEISQHLNIPVGTSKWHLASARGILKDKLKKSAYNIFAYHHG